MFSVLASLTQGVGVMFNIFAPACWLGFHMVGVGEISYNFETREITLHCKNCQKAIDKIENEHQLTDGQYHWFKKIFENF